jgi:hypothetical protein
VRRFVLIGLLVAGAASAQSNQATGAQPVASPGSAQLDGSPYALPEKPLSLVLNPGICDDAPPVTWRDASDPLRFASQPLQQLSSGGSEYAQLTPFIDVRMTISALRVFFVGASLPTLGHIQLVPGTGWQLAGC